MNFFATTPKGLELLLVEELRALGAVDASEKLAGVTFSGDLALAYKACLWSRLANRILFRLTKIPASTPEELYAGVQTIDWSEHLSTEGSLSVNFVCSHSNITHTLFGAQKVKDAIVDQFRDKFSERPNVERSRPDLAIHVHLHRNYATISLDLSGESLHKRGYRLEQGIAPLKENLAAAILLRNKWPDLAQEGRPLIDPMCGSGTLLIEAAMMAANIAPGLSRDYFGFLNWKKHDSTTWAQLIDQANKTKNKNLIPSIVGYDMDSYAIKISAANIERAGLTDYIQVSKQPLLACQPKNENNPGLFVVNPPYGERLGEVEELKELYQQLGAKLKSDFVGWKASVFTANPDLGKNMGLRAHKQYALFNGTLACQLLMFDVQPEKFVDRSPAANNERRIRYAQKVISQLDIPPPEDFINRIKKKLKHVKRWANRENIIYYRLYDADLPEFAVAIDFFQASVLVQEYVAPKSIDSEKSSQRLQQVLSVLPELLNVPPAAIFFKSVKEASEFPEGFKETELELKIPPK